MAEPHFRRGHAGLRADRAGLAAAAAVGRARPRARSLTPSGQGAGFLEAEPRAATEQLAVIAVADVAQEVRFEAAVGEEGLVDDRVVETAHAANVEPHRTGRNHQVSALQCA